MSTPETCILAIVGISLILFAIFFKAGPESNIQDKAPTIEFENKTYSYCVWYNPRGEYFGKPWTSFYSDEICTEPAWTFLKWKSKKMVRYNPVVFAIPIDIFDKQYSKEEVQNYISKAVHSEERRTEIKNGEVI